MKPAAEIMNSTTAAVALMLQFSLGSNPIKLRLSSEIEVIIEEFVDKIFLKGPVDYWGVNFLKHA